MPQLSKTGILSEHSFSVYLYVEDAVLSQIQSRKEVPKSRNSKRSTGQTEWLIKMPCDCSMAEIFLFRMAILLKKEYPVKQPASRPADFDMRPGLKSFLSTSDYDAESSSSS